MITSKISMQKYLTDQTKSEVIKQKTKEILLCFDVNQKKVDDIFLKVEKEIDETISQLRKEQEVVKSLQKTLALIDKDVRNHFAEARQRFSYKQLGLQGVIVADDIKGQLDRRYFETISKDVFDSLQDQASFKLKSLRFSADENTVMQGIGGIDVKSSDGEVTSLNFGSIDLNRNLTLNLQDFDVQTIEMQGYEGYGRPFGYLFTSRGENPRVFDVQEYLYGEGKGKNRHVPAMSQGYATLTPKEELIGVYGYYSSNQLQSLGFIVKEPIQE